MRYPLWAFFLLFILPPLTLHALLVGKAQVHGRPAADQLATFTHVPGQVLPSGEMVFGPPAS